VTPNIRLVLVGILLTLFSVEYTLLVVAHFDVDLIALLKILVVAMIPLSAGLYYVFVRSDERVSAMLFGLAFLLVFAPLCTILNYFAVSIAGHRIDDFLAHVDQSIGIDWPSLMIFALIHPVIVKMLGMAYTISAFQLAIPLIVLGLDGDPKDISRLCIAATLCALATIAFWTVLPSFGAYTVYDLALIGHKAHSAIDTTYPQYLSRILVHGTGHVIPTNAGGLVGFPSFHTEEMVLAIWYIRKQRVFFWPVLIFSVIALASVPVQGGHHVVDVFGGVVFAGVGIMVARRLVDWLTNLNRAQLPMLANAAIDAE
jgi:hypothetical protein